MHDDNKSRFHEIEETRTSAAQDRFEEILQKVKAAGAHIDRDEESPLYADVAQQEVEIGRRRIVEFSLNHTDFQITRDEKTARITGAGPGQKSHRAALEQLPVPAINIKLKSKPELSQQWVAVEIEDVF
ncbi:MAG TPA: hypothetical protein P5229_01375 [Candidatus Gracilibacteria bacterium]|nr:hypothetical protein [Candidatus Gracilibacteria bacterium]